MPQGDRTGPEGKGAKTGRGLGLCSGNDTPGYTRGTPRGRSLGRGMGAGYGRRFGFQNREILTKEEEKRILETQKAEIEKKIKELQ